MGKYAVTYNSVAIATYPTHDEAWLSIHRRQGQSVDYALKHGGYGIEEIESSDKQPEADVSS